MSRNDALEKMKYHLAACGLLVMTVCGCKSHAPISATLSSAPPAYSIQAPNNLGIATQGQTGNNTIINPPPPSAPKPEVVLHFVYPTSPALVLQNVTDGIARDMLWEVVLWNIDLPDRIDPLPIPSTAYSWLRPRSSGGPQSLFDTPQVASLLKPGSRLYGSAEVSCPECERSHTYFVFIKWGESGWFAEAKDAPDGQLLIPRPPFTTQVIAAYAQTIENIVPASMRVPIGPL